MSSQIITKFINRQNYTITYDISNNNEKYIDTKLLFEYSNNILYISLTSKHKNNSYEENFIEFNRVNSLLHIGRKLNDKYTSYRLVKTKDNIFLFNYNLNSLLDGNNIIIDNEKKHYFMGSYKNGKINGKAIERKYESINSDNTPFDLYIGEYKENKFDGDGLLNCPNYVYNGNFVKGVKDGKCELIIKNKQHKFNGDIKNNILEGIGEYTFQNGDIFKGEIKNNKANGKGIIIFNDNENYKGKFDNHKKVGEGKYTTKNNHEFISFYENGEDIKEKNIYKY